jgi:hypothetical protein
MNKKILGGIIVLIALVGIAGVFLLIGRKTDTESEKVYKAPSEEVMEKVRDGLTARKAQEAAKPQSPGEKTETGHRHDDGTWHEGEHVSQPNVRPTETAVQVKAYPHQKLLDTHPVEALRQLAIEKGHWSAEFIPPFPPEDREAAELARAVYILAHHWTTVRHPEESHDHIHSAEYEQAEQLIEAHRKARREWTNAKNKARREGRYKEFYNPDDLARWNDLGRLTYSRTLSNRPPPVPLSEMRTWSSMFNDIRY